MLLPLSAKKSETLQNILQIPIDAIRPCPFQPRKLLNKQALEDLTQSIKENGILQPLTATRIDDGEYQLIAGHRRLLAAGKAGLKTVPVLVLDKSNQEIAVLSVIENLQREDLNYFEQAMAIQTLITQLHLTQSQVGEKLSLSQPAVANKLKLLQFSKEKQLRMLASNLNERHARAISRLPAEKQDRAIDFIIKNQLNVTKTDKYINSLLNPKQRTKQNTIISIKDIRLFTNTISKAVKLMQLAGFDTHYQQQEEGEYIKYSIIVPKTKTELTTV
ncbi:MAG: ParB/RepB/Spo0J family partition protein [Oscillospiraceae bacterium]